jgi:hypothetical protein
VETMLAGLRQEPSGNETIARVQAQRDQE